MKKPELTREQENRFKSKIIELSKSPDALEAFKDWDETFVLLPNTDIFMLSGFKREKLRRKAAHDYVALINSVTNRTI